MSMTEQITQTLAAWREAKRIARANKLAIKLQDKLKVLAKTEASHGKDSHGYALRLGEARKLLTQLIQNGDPGAWWYEVTIQRCERMGVLPYTSPSDRL